MVSSCSISAMSLSSMRENAVWTGCREQELKRRIQDMRIAPIQAILIESWFITIISIPSHSSIRHSKGSSPRNYTDHPGYQYYSSDPDTLSVGYSNKEKLESKSKKIAHHDVRSIIINRHQLEVSDDSSFK